MNWQDFEVSVREIAASHWNTSAIPEVVAGVKCDAVLRPSADEMIVVEITKEKDLSKLRTDLAKFASIRSAFVPDGIVVRSIFISAHEVSSLRETGKAQKVEVLSVREFREKFVGKDAYEFQRRSAEFGSAIDPETKKTDQAKFVHVEYIEGRTGAKLGVADIASRLKAGERVILLGEFGTGKSRCAKEVFEILSKEELLFPVFAINLREHWGHQSFDLIVRSHLKSLGLSNLEDGAVRLARNGHISFLLDGFDEIGSQSWSGEPERLREIRRRSLAGVRDLVNRTSGKGILLCGRAHYFSNDSEMLDCLGLDENCTIIRCPDEFTEAQAEIYLKQTTGLAGFPEWSPRKPLICQLFSKLDTSAMNKLMAESKGEVQFFENSLQAICERETRIHQSIDASILRSILLEISLAGRRKNEINEEISPTEINDIFYKVSGFSPMDEASAILQRLPYLGRVGSGSGNRQFVDEYVRSGLRGVALKEAFLVSNKVVAEDLYKKPVGKFGSRFLGAAGLLGPESEKYVKLCTSRGNTQIAADYLCSVNEYSDGIIDFGGMIVTRASIDWLEFSDIEVKNLILEEVFVDQLKLDGAAFIKCDFRNSIFRCVDGVSDKAQLPDCFRQDCEFEVFSSVDNVSRISELPLSDEHKTLIAIIRKLFFQPGSGRMEEALLRGTSKYWKKNAAEVALNYMLRTGIVMEVPGNRGKLFIPNRQHTRRMGKVRSLLSNCGDELWQVIEEVRS